MASSKTPTAAHGCAAGCKYAGEELGVNGKLTKTQFRRIEQILGYPRGWLGRHKGWASAYHFDPLTPRSARAVCAYLREIGVAHEHRTIRSWTRRSAADAECHEGLSQEQRELLEAAERCVEKRTFEALKYAKDDPERHRLNSRRRTSEYQRSLRYEADIGHRSVTFKTKPEAITWALAQLRAIDARVTAF